MTENRKIYSRTFKQKAVELSNVRCNVQEVARELGVGAELIERWRKEMHNAPDLAFGGSEKPSLGSHITNIRTMKGWLYLTTVMELRNRKATGWSQRINMSPKSTSIAASKMAVRNRSLTDELIFHSDRGHPVRL